MTPMLSRPLPESARGGKRKRDRQLKAAAGKSPAPARLILAAVLVGGSLGLLVWAGVQASATSRRSKAPGNQAVKAQHLVEHGEEWVMPNSRRRPRVARARKLLKEHGDKAAVRHHRVRTKYMTMNLRSIVAETPAEHAGDKKKGPAVESEARLSAPPARPKPRPTDKDGKVIPGTSAGGLSGGEPAVE